VEQDGILFHAQRWNKMASCSTLKGGTRWHLVPPAIRCLIEIGCPPHGELPSESADQHQQDSDHDMQNIVNPRPFEMLFGEETQIARYGLVDVNQTETGVERFDGHRVIAQNYDGADEAENYVKDIVRGRAAHSTFVRWNDETENSNQNQHGSENSQGEKIQVIENHRGNPFRKSQEE
jgi:hypothetical protein